MVGFKLGLFLPKESYIICLIAQLRFIKVSQVGSIFFFALQNGEITKQRRGRRKMNAKKQ